MDYTIDPMVEGEGGQQRPGWRKWLKSEISTSYANRRRRQMWAPGASTCDWTAGYLR